MNVRLQVTTKIGPSGFACEEQIVPQHWAGLAVRMRWDFGAESPEQLGNCGNRSRNHVICGNRSFRVQSGSASGQSRPVQLRGREERQYLGKWVIDRGVKRIPSRMQ